MNSKKWIFSNRHLNVFGDKRIRLSAQQSRKKKMLMKKFLGVLIICSLVAPVSADTFIEYTLNGNWIYEQEYAGTLSLADNPSGGITATINAPNGIEGGGLDASRYDLAKFSPGNDGFIELYYSSLMSTMTGNPSLDLCLEVEFYDSINNHYQIALHLVQSAGPSIFATSFVEDSSPDNYIEQPIPNGVSTNEGALGLYWHDSYVSAYFKDVQGNLLYPFSLDWDISGIEGSLNFSVDNDFDADTLYDGGGTVIASVNLRQVVYGSGYPPAWYGDHDSDGDVDGLDLTAFIAGESGISLDVFAMNFGKSN